MSEAYEHPVAQLLTLGDPRHGDHTAAEGWRDYAALGLTTAQIPELVRMAVDKDLHEADPESAEVWAPLHAWRALGQLRAESAVEPLLRLLDRVDDVDDEWVQDDLPLVFGMIGPAAMAGLRDLLGDVAHGNWARITAVEGLVRIVERSPESREQAVAFLTDQLRRFAEQDRTFNAALVDDLCRLKAVESAAVMEQAFTADAVDLAVLGDWEEAQIYLGLLEKRLTPARNFVEEELGFKLSFGGLRLGKPAPRKADRQKKARRKQAKASRRRNRKR